MITHAMPAGASVQVATRSGSELVPLAGAADDSLVGVLPFGATDLLAPDGQALSIQPGPIAFADAIAAPTEAIARLASFIPEMCKSHRH